MTKACLLCFATLTFAVTPAAARPNPHRANPHRANIRRTQAHVRWYPYYNWGPGWASAANTEIARLWSATK